MNLITNRSPTASFRWLLVFAALATGLGVGLPGCGRQSEQQPLAGSDPVSTSLPQPSGEPATDQKTTGASSGSALLPASAGQASSASAGTASSPALGGPSELKGKSDILPSAVSPRRIIDTSGYREISLLAQQWSPHATLPEIRSHWEGITHRAIARLDRELQMAKGDWKREMEFSIPKAGAYMYSGKPEDAYTVLKEVRNNMQRRGGSARDLTLGTLTYFQGIAALRLGENENCIMCRGESSCIIPINSAAIHQNPKGSRLAIEHFTEYLQKFPDDLEAQWLLNVAHMTLGEHPDKVDPRFLISLDRFRNSEFDIGKFRDIGHLVGVNRFDQAGGVIMEDFDNDGLLDLAVTSWDATQPMAVYRNTGDGTYANCSQTAGVEDQLGGLNCVQTDFNNDGLMDIFIPRGAWWKRPIRPSLLRNDGQLRFTDVTQSAGLMEPLNSVAAGWADYDNDGWLDLFVCCEMQKHRLYRNLGNGQFQEVAAQAGLDLDGQQTGKGCTWIDYDNDDFPDLFINYLGGEAQLYHNQRDGTFSNTTAQMGIDGPHTGFSCWSWDYDNDGWLDIFATSFDQTLAEVVQGLTGQPLSRQSSKLYRNLGGQGFRDVTKEAGLNLAFSAMGTNYGDFDNDGFLDMYLGTGDPDLSTLVPNRMFKNVGGQRFSEITGSAGVGHLQKGHGVACGDWDRDGNIDIFIEMGGAVDGDKYHNILFQNPGHDHSWLTVKLIGAKTNRAALGARIKIVTASDKPLTVHRHVTHGSSFGSSPLQQTIGLGDADRIATLEIHWPTSGTTQVFRDLAVNQAVEITELAGDYKALDWKPVVHPAQ